MKRLLHILPLLLLAGLLSVGACQRQPGPAETEEYGTLTLQIGPGADATLTKSEPDPRDGEVFHNILVIVADKNGVVMDKAFKEYTTATDNDWIDFTNLKVGYYQVYAYANIEEPDWQISGQTIEDVEKALVSAKDNPDAPGTVNPDRQFATQAGSNTPDFPDHCMLLTGHDELYVGVDPYIGRIDLYRPVVKFEVMLDNHTPYPVQLTDLHFNNFNASDSYLIGRKDDDGNPVIPANNTYRALPAFAGPASIPAREQATVYSQLLYENCIGQDYRMFATVRFADENGNVVYDESSNPLTDNNGQPRSKTLASSTVRRVPYTDIRDMANGASMNVLMVTPNTGNGGFLGYMSTSTESRLLFDQATYNFEDSFRSKAEALLNNKTNGVNYQLRLYKDDSGKYHVFRDARDLFTLAGSSINGLNLKEGHLPSDYPISQEFAGSLCRFTNGAEDNAYSLYYLNLALKLDKNANYGNRMWTFYEIHPEGTVLKLIDRETSRVSTLSRMVRGQKLTAVMNVYFEAESGEFTFSLDNAYWEEGHNPKHMFQ